MIGVRMTKKYDKAVRLAVIKLLSEFLDNTYCNMYERVTFDTVDYDKLIDALCEMVKNGVIDD
jgi:hypothetical protein